MRALNWRKSTLGIFGLGNIGKQVANQASHLGFEVVYNNRSQVPDAPFDFVTKEELLARSDIVLVLIPLSNETRHFIDEKALSKAKDGVILVNVGQSLCFFIAMIA